MPGTANDELDKAASIGGLFHFKWFTKRSRLRIASTRQHVIDRVQESWVVS
jgi:hypothetical protein